MRLARASGDDVTEFQLALLVPKRAIVIGAGDGADEAPAGQDIELDAHSPCCSRK